MYIYSTCSTLQCDGTPSTYARKVETTIGGVIRAGNGVMCAGKREKKANHRNFRPHTHRRAFSSEGSRRGEGSRKVKYTSICMYMCGETVVVASS